MDFVRFGTSGLRVSRLCLGCMTYGDPAWRPWVLNETESRQHIKNALDAGINFFDTADVYSQGMSERILGKAIADYGKRDDAIIATKVFFPTSDKPNDRGLSRKHILGSIDASLKRLGSDYVDLYIIHRFDPDTPVEETAEALDSIVRAGKVRYIGASSMHAWQFMKLLAFQKHNHLASFVSMQSQYNLITRFDEYDLLPLCAEEGIALTPWSPLARGVLAGSRTSGTVRADTDQQAPQWYGDRDEVNATVDAVRTIAEARQVSPAQIALAWVLANPAVTAPVIGSSKSHHLGDAIEALGIALSQEELSALEAPMDVTLRKPMW